MYANPGARERAFNLIILFLGSTAENNSAVQNPFPGVHESCGDLFLRWSFKVRKKILKKTLKKTFENDAH